MFDWIIERRDGKWCVIETYCSYQDDVYYERILYKSEHDSQSDCLEWRSQHTAYYF